MFAVIGLGNPGTKYKGTRHNIGFAALDHIAGKFESKFSDRHKLAEFVSVNHGEEQLLLVKPKTFMNNSGKAVSYIMSRFGLSIDQIVVIYDYLDLPVGKIRIRPNGSAGGHNGIASIISALNTSSVSRIRIGIGRPGQSVNQIGYVLGKFSTEEENILGEVSSRVHDAVIQIVEDGIDTAMNTHN